MDRVPRLWRKTATRDPDAELRDLQQRFRTIRAKASNLQTQSAEPVELRNESAMPDAAAQDVTTTGPWSSPPAHAATIPNRVFRQHSTSSVRAKSSPPFRGFLFASVMGAVVGFAVVALSITFGV